MQIEIEFITLSISTENKMKSKMGNLMSTIIYKMMR